MAACLTSEEGAQNQTCYRVADSKVKRPWTKSGRGCDISSQQGRQSDSAIAGKLVQSHGEAALSGSNEIDLHQHRHGPGEALVGSEQHIGRNDPRPVWRVD